MATSPIISWQIDGEQVETVTDFLFLGSKITVDGNCSHENKRCLLLGRKAMTKLDSILKSRDITLPIKVHLVKAMVFLVVMYRCASWTIKRAEHLRIDAFELWCWRRLLRVPWTTRRSNQIHPKGNQSWIFTGRADAEAETPNTLATWCEELTHLKRPWCWEKLKVRGEGDDRGWDGWMASPTQWMWVWVNSRSWWWTGRPGMLQSIGSQRVGHDWATELNWDSILKSRHHVADYDQPRQHIKKQRHHFADKGPYSQSYGFPSSHVWMWELDHKEGWALKNWCFWIVVLEKTLESPLHGKIKPVNPKGHQPWIFLGRTDTKAEVQILCPPAKNQVIRKDPDAGKVWRQKEKGTAEDEIGKIASLAQWTWIWANSWRWKTEKLGCAIVHGVAKIQIRLSDWTMRSLNYTSEHLGSHLFPFQTLRLRSLEDVDWTNSALFLVHEHTLAKGNRHSCLHLIDEK